MCLNFSSKGEGISLLEAILSIWFCYGKVECGRGYKAKFKIYDRSYLKENIESKNIKATDEERLDEEIDKDINNSYS